MTQPYSLSSSQLSRFQFLLFIGSMTLRRHWPHQLLQRSSPFTRMSTIRPSVRCLSKLRARPARSPLTISQFRRHYADLPKPPNPDRPGTVPPKGVWAPKTRLAFGIVFIGALIYSMVFLTHPVYHSSADHRHRSQKSQPSLTHRQ